MAVLVVTTHVFAYFLEPQGTTIDMDNAEWYGPDAEAFNNQAPVYDPNSRTQGSFTPGVLQPGISIFTEAMG